MDDRENPLIACHKDPVLFRESVNYSAADTGFAARLIEKDYFCTVLLSYLTALDERLVFKGGTCLTKVHTGFYRLSEDLDFAMPLPTEAGRSDRSKQIRPLKRAMVLTEQHLSGFSVTTPLQGMNNSRQYNAVIRYRSLLDGRDETIKIEISLREPLLRPAILGPSRTILLDPISGEPAVPVIPVRCISSTEAMAEKCRAAMTRREVAIRDFFDIAYAVERHALNIKDAEFLALVKDKLSVLGNEAICLGPERLAALKAQLSSRLKPVLREPDFTDFDIEKAFSVVTEIARFIEHGKQDG